MIHTCPDCGGILIEDLDGSMYYCETCKYVCDKNEENTMKDDLYNKTSERLWGKYAWGLR